MTSTPAIAALLCLAVMAASFILTGWARRLALRHLFIDVPNARSSHQLATPRGGGVAIVITALVGLIALAALGIDRAAVVWLCVGGVIAGAIGLADDRGHIPARWRLVAHFAAAACVLAPIGGLPPFAVFGIAVSSAIIRVVVTAVGLVWLLNLTNFMDGIDGIASVETITVCVGAALLAFLCGSADGLWIEPLILAAATVGFLAWNLPPAKIFMGDVGSGFLGLILGGLALRAAWNSPQLFWGWVILLGAFVVDATVTLLRRLVRGERVYEAHRSHAYQHAAQRHGHATVTTWVGVINVAWLLPVAWLVVRGRLAGPAGLLLAYAPIIGLALWLGAGRPTDRVVRAETLDG